MLIVLGGLPGTGKSTIAERVARRMSAVYLRIDVIEQAMRDALGLTGDIRDSGYRVAYSLAEANLRLGLSVVADSANPIEITRECWRGVATAAGTDCLEVEIVCGDSEEHRRRVETRSADIPGLRLPTWDEVVAREYEPWTSADMVIDSSAISAEEAAAAIVARAAP